MQIVADLHTHSVASGHAYGTISEMLKAASEKGHLGLGITDHGPAMPDGAHHYYFSNMSTLPKTMFGIRFYHGVESNIIDTEGNIDIPADIQPWLDYMIASMHIGGVSPQGHSASENTQTWAKAMQNPLIKILGHPENPHFPIIVPELVAAAKEYGKIIEINSASFIVRKGSEPIMREIVTEAAKQQVMMAITSDAHFMNRIGDYELSLKLAEELGVSEELIVNTSLEKIDEYLLGGVDSRFSKKFE